jgi:hypothetical protein
VLVVCLNEWFGAVRLRISMSLFQSYHGLGIVEEAAVISKRLLGHGLPCSAAF